MFKYSSVLVELDEIHITSVLFDFRSEALIFAEMSIYKYLTTSFAFGACNWVIGFRFEKCLFLISSCNKECEIFC